MITQISVDIPDDIIERINSGELTRYGGTARSANGRLVDIFDDAPLDKSDNAQSEVKTILQECVIGIGRAIIIVVAKEIVEKIVVPVIKDKTIPAIKNFIDKKTYKKEIRYVDAYNESLCAYLNAMSKGTVELNLINHLIVDLDALKENVDSQKVIIEFSLEQLDVLNKLFEYTQKLAKANSFENNNIIAPQGNTGLNNIITLRSYLEIQRQIFNEVA